MKSVLCLLLTWTIFSCCLAAPVSLQEPDPETIGEHFEGDIILDSPIRHLINNPTRRWPLNTIYYKLDPGFSDGQKVNILIAMLDISIQTYLRFEEASPDRLDYVSFNLRAAGSGCNSNVGYLARTQDVNLANGSSGAGCFAHGVIMHEILHTCGFWHQHSAPERDNYIAINWGNIASGKEQFFNKKTIHESTSFGIPYDCASIMHYAPKAFSSNGQDTIVPIVPSCSGIGQRKKLSDMDISKLRMMYPAGPTYS